MEDGRLDQAQNLAPQQAGVADAQSDADHDWSPNSNECHGPGQRTPFTMIAPRSEDTIHVSHNDSTGDITIQCTWAKLVRRACSPKQIEASVEHSVLSQVSEVFQQILAPTPPPAPNPTGYQVGMKIALSPVAQTS